MFEDVFRFPSVLTDALYSSCRTNLILLCRPDRSEDSATGPRYQHWFRVDLTGYVLFFRLSELRELSPYTQLHLISSVIVYREFLLTAHTDILLAIPFDKFTPACTRVNTHFVNYTCNTVLHLPSATSYSDRTRVGSLV